MKDSGPTRRELLRGLLRPRGEAAAPTTSGQAKPFAPTETALPSVISWLDPQMQATPRRSRRDLPGAVWIRPPGALHEGEFIAACTGCGDCARACEPGAIQLRALLPRNPPTPVIDPYTEPCRLCEGLPCLAACEAGALRPEAPAVLGTAQVRAQECLNRLGSPCSVCVEHCPVEGALRLGAGLPITNAALCTGCGICAYVCPAPTRAIAMLPNPRRPRREELEPRGSTS